MSAPDYVATVSVVVPVYQGEGTLPRLIADIAPLATPSRTPGGVPFVVAEVLLVHDCGPDRSAEVIQAAADEHDWVRPVWLSRNFGQHPATLAGMSSSVADWIVTMDEDGQHDPQDIATLLDVAVAQGAQLVYGRPAEGAPHARWRNATSAAAKWVYTRLLAPGEGESFGSFRLMLGELGRSVGAYAGSGVYLDVALTWVVDRTATIDVEPRAEFRESSGYPLRRLLSHFLRLMLSSGTRPLRLVSLFGLASVVLGLIYSAYLVYDRTANGAVVQGWTTVVLLIVVIGGIVLFSLGILAEYLGVVVRNAIGRPLYLIRSNPLDDAVVQARRCTEDPPA